MDLLSALAVVYLAFCIIYVVVHIAKGKYWDDKKDEKL